MTIHPETEITMTPLDTETRQAIGAGAAGFLIFILLVAIIAVRPAAGQIWPDCATGQGNLNNMSLVIAADSVDQDLFGGALLGAFTPDGDCVGMTYINADPTKNTTLNIRGSDSMSPDPRGADVGETVNLRILNEIRPAVQVGVLIGSDTEATELTYEHDAAYFLRSAGFPMSTDAQEAIDQLQSELDAMTAERDQLQADFDSAQNQLDTVTAERDALQTSLDTVTSERDQLQSDLDAANAENVDLNDRISQAIAILSGSGGS